MNMNGEVKEGSLEIDSDNNLKQFKTGSGAEEAVEIHDFQIVSEFVLVLSLAETLHAEQSSKAVSVNMASL